MVLENFLKVILEYESVQVKIYCQQHATDTNLIELGLLDSETRRCIEVDLTFFYNL